MDMPSLREVLWKAQGGQCWRCGEPMVWRFHNSPKTASLDHVFPRSITGAVGNVGVTLLAHKVCDNQAQPPRWPTDAEIRRLVAIYRSAPSWWLRSELCAAEARLTHLRPLQVKAGVLSALIGEAA